MHPRDMDTWALLDYLEARDANSDARLAEQQRARVGEG